jgi:Holliday junction resolvase
MLNPSESNSLFVTGIQTLVEFLKTKEKFGTEEVLLLHHLQQSVNVIRPDLSEDEATTLRVQLQLLGSPDSRQRR